MRKGAGFLLATTSLLLSIRAVISLDCSHIRHNHKKYNFEELHGPHSVSVVDHVPPSIHNSTYTIDLCNPLKKKEGIPREDQCPTGTHGTKPLERFECKEAQRSDISFFYS